MDNRTKTALEKSIAKWEANAVAKEVSEYKVSAQNCPLCDLFLDNYDSGADCDGCPIKTKTQQARCRGTPYTKAVFIKVLWSDNHKAGTEEKYKRQVAHKVAMMEVDFLKSLREQEPIT